MDKKNLMSQATQSVNKLATQNLPSELTELSEEVLSEVRGGWLNPDIIVVGPIKWPPIIELCCFCWNPPNPPIKDFPDINHIGSIK